ncbi:MAG: hypothetical protein QNJ29_14310 [Rhizobiaceae bacterium]|nr:hypothetical protein [Rhizobiaceae bacterium]
MLKAILSAVISPIVGVLLFVITANAQGVDSSQINKMFAVLNLTEAQKAEAKPIVLEGFNERMSILETVGLEPGTKPTFQQVMKLRGPISASQRRTEARLSEVLSPMQMDQYRAFVSERRKEFRAKIQ